MSNNKHTNVFASSQPDEFDVDLRKRNANAFLNIGIVGAGAFADFAIQSFLQVDGVRIIAVTDTNESAAINMANKNAAVFYADLSFFLENESIDLVYIATPPFLHYEQSKAALLAGKHVICEKPAAFTSKEAQELVDLASSKNVLYVVNLMQRYNPLYTIVQAIIKEKLLGNFLHGYFENYASDENLNEDHWFWNETKSGGIFIEHGVHFFDMFAGWLGNGQVLNACELPRSADRKIIDRVQASVLYNNAIVNFYHGFDQPKILDRQEMRLLFERGEITLYEWIPVKMKLHGLLKNDQLDWLKKKLPGLEIVDNGDAHSKNGIVTGRFTEIHFDKEITLEYGNTASKQHCYSRLLTDMLTDQTNWIKDRAHKRIIDGNNAVESIRIAQEAHKIAKIIND